MVFSGSGAGLSPGLPWVYLVLTIATPILGSEDLRVMNAKALSLVVVWYSYQWFPYLYLTMKTLRLISFMIFSRRSGWEPSRSPGWELCYLEDHFTG